MCNENPRVSVKRKTNQTIFSNFAEEKPSIVHNPKSAEENKPNQHKSIIVFSKLHILDIPHIWVDIYR